MANQVVTAVVPSLQMKVLVSTGGEETNFKNPGIAMASLKLLRAFGNGDGQVVVGIMGGPGQELFERCRKMGFSVKRIPIYRLQEKGLDSGASASERAQALLGAFAESPEMFYPLEEDHPTLAMIRELTRHRLTLQEDRKRLTNRMHRTLRTLQFVLPSESQSLIEMLRERLKNLSKSSKLDPDLSQRIDEEFKRLGEQIKMTDRDAANLFALRVTFSDPRLISAIKAEEERLEGQITTLLRSLPFCVWLDPKNTSLPRILGMGPSIRGSIISEIGVIVRFPTREAFRAYARFHVNREGKFPARRAGEVSNFSRYLNRAVWLWATDQMARYDHLWRACYDWKKAMEFKAHLDPVARKVKTKSGSERTVYDYNLGHLDKRAKRWTGSQMLNYLWDLWQAFATGHDLEAWYSQSSWPAYFAKIQQELEAGLAAYLVEEIKRRKKTDPKEEPDLDEEGGEG